MNKNAENCHQYRDWSERLEAGEIDDRIPRSLLDHLAVCTACQSEKAEMENTLELLGSLEEVEPPRHFFVYQERERGKQWRSWWKALLVPQVVATVSSLALLLTLGVLVSGLQVRSEGASLTLGFGNLPALAKPHLERDPELLRADFRAILAQEMEARDRQVLEQVRSEISSFSNELSESQQQRLESVVASLEDRLDENLQERDHVLSESLRTVAIEIYQTLLDQQQTGLQNLNARLQRVEAAGHIQGTQTEALMATVLELARRQD